MIGYDEDEENDDDKIIIPNDDNNQVISRSKNRQKLIKRAIESNQGDIENTNIIISNDDDDFEMKMMIHYDHILSESSSSECTVNQPPSTADKIIEYLSATEAFKNHSIHRNVGTPSQRSQVGELSISNQVKRKRRVVTINGETDDTLREGFKNQNAKESVQTSLAQLKNGFEQVLIDERTQLKTCLRIVFYYREAWRMLIIPDWRLEGLGQVEHQR